MNTEVSPAPGIYTIPSEQYHADPCAVPSLSSSIARILLSKSPAHARLAHPRLNPHYVEREASSRMDVGSAAHAMLLEGTDIVAVCCYDDWRKKEAQAARDEARALGKIPLLLHQYDKVMAMYVVAESALKTCTDLGGFEWSHGKPEQTVIWQEGDTHCRVRADWLSNDRRLILDFKTTEIANPAAWMRSLPSMGYDVQAAFYKRGVRAVTHIDPDFVFMVQETEAPYLCYFVGMPPAYLEIGRIKVEAALRLWTDCVEADSWPGYPPNIMYPDPPSWVLAEAEELACAEGNGFALFDKDAPGMKEAFLFGKVPEEVNNFTTRRN